MSPEHQSLLVSCALCVYVLYALRCATAGAVGSDQSASFQQVHPLFVVHNRCVCVCVGTPGWWYYAHHKRRCAVCMPVPLVCGKRYARGICGRPFIITGRHLLVPRDLFCGRRFTVQQQLCAAPRQVSTWSLRAGLQQQLSAPTWATSAVVCESLEIRGNATKYPAAGRPIPHSTGLGFH